MKKNILLILILILSLILISGCNDNDINSKSGVIKIAVSIVPQEAFVKAVGGDLVDVVTMIPAGASTANYQPTPQQMVELSDASVYFTIGVPAEKANIVPKLPDINKNIEVISFEEIVSKIYPSIYLDEHTHDESETGITSENNINNADPHIWLSPKRVVVMIESIRDKLIILDKKNEATYTKNANKYINDLKNLDSEIIKAFSIVKQNAFIIYHPAYGYFADDYGLKMITIEENGKIATFERLELVINFAKLNNIKVIFYQDEFDSSQAETIAKEINGVAVDVSPLSFDYIASMKQIIEKLGKVIN